MEERDYLYLKGTEELGDVIEILQDFKGNEIVLVVPVGTKALSHPVNVDLLKKEFFKQKKKIYFSTEDKKISDLLKAAGFNVFLEEYDNPEELHKIVTDIIVPSKSKPPKIKKTPAKSDSTQATKRKLKFSLKKLLGVFISLFVLVMAIAFGLDKFTSKALITITLKADEKDFQEMIELRTKALSNDLQNQILKGEKIELIKTHTVNVSTTGEGSGGNRAKGQVNIYNSSSNSLSLIQGTRFQSPDGKIYRMTKRIFIPAQTDGGEAIAEVIADENGDKYNVSAKTEFQIPGLKGTSWESKIKTIAKEEITGGGSSGIKIVTPDDVVGGKVKLEKEIKQLMLKEIITKYANYIFPEDGGNINISQPDISHQVGQSTDRLVFAGKGELKTIGVKKEMLINFIKDLIASKNLKEQANVRISELKIENFRVMDFDTKMTYLKVQVSGKVKVKGNIDAKEIAKQLTDKNLENVKDILKNNPVVENAEASIWPFWNNKLPENPDKIEIKLK